MRRTARSSLDVNAVWVSCHNGIEETSEGVFDLGQRSLCWCEPSCAHHHDTHLRQQQKSSCFGARQLVQHQGVEIQ